MEQHIKSIWRVFKSLKTEAFYLFYEENDALKSFKISKNETKNSGEIDVEKVVAIAPALAGKKVVAIHNHPDSLPTPSFPDLFQKDYVDSLLALCNIEMMDYGIVSPYGYISFLENGLLKKEKITAFYKTEEVIHPGLPFLFFNKDIAQKEALFIQALQKTPEIVLNNKEQYGSICFPGTFLLSKRRDFVSKNILFYGKDLTENNERLRQLDAVLEPFEIYGLHNARLMPLKLYGFL